ncbi:hypothetical protein AL755_18540 [Arthrobacter sp. ERGS1:01]|uniref:NAD(P)H-hydrate epimerase n=1 Tax=Arthrobacter sp. ERGS1:01 TaxID=1704044 RepID=UPI0006B4A0F2|nr:NAD(P)H-hydrate epimerase [Arthrobacter sp. ERGS1:01]ALE06993.1 hypothetical protein AL755_18540 [Arthrobacter sp. ERGS1:01]
MLHAYTAAAVRAAEQPLLDAGHGPALMQRAAHGLAMGILGVLRGRGRPVYGARVVVLAGSGNNGGDALYAGAYLARRGARTTALLTSDRTHPDALLAFENAGGRIERLLADAAPDAAGHAAAFLAEARAADVVVDGLLGTGGRGGLREPSASIVAQLCQIAAGGHGPAVVACDLPSGIDPDSGEVHPPVLAADVTVTFGAVKTGLVCAPAEQLCGEVVLVDIGVEAFLPEPDVVRLESADLATLLPSPSVDDQKYTRGVAGIVAGSAQYPGAALLAVAAASACGPGMVRYLGEPAVQAAIHLRNPEAVCSADAPSDVRVQAWLAGPGIDGDDGQARRAREAMASGLPTVVDAGALALLAVGSSGSNAHLVLTPHAGELSTLLARHGVTTPRAAIEAAPLAAARAAARLTGAVVLLKGPTTVVAAPDGSTFTQADGTPRLATAGSGDTLAGILGALLAMNAGRDDPDELAVVAALAAALHGRLAHEDPHAPLNAGMLAARIPAAWAALTR